MNAFFVRCMKLVFLFVFLVLSGCAIHSGAGGEFQSHGSQWQGRLMLKVHTDPAQAFSADFDLQGDAQAGSLTFFTPLGSTAARLDWSEQGAQLQTTGEPQQFESLEALTLQTIGTVLPMASLFEWLKGMDPVTPGWRADLRDLSSGRLHAQRLAPEIPADLKIILDR